MGSRLFSYYERIRCLLVF
uniref:Uncharacterized protein n=1 Tax=Arundo donax TaxID=35708 RepID=A0A0A9FNJ2_ARUDO